MKTSVFPPLFAIFGILFMAWVAGSFGLAGQGLLAALLMGAQIGAIQGFAETYPRRIDRAFGRTLFGVCNFISLLIFVGVAWLFTKGGGLMFVAFLPAAQFVALCLVYRRH